METVAEENPLRSATSRMVTAAVCTRLVDDSAPGARRGFGGEALRVGFESVDLDFMDSLNSGLLLADTTGR